MNVVAAHQLNQHILDDRTLQSKEPADLVNRPETGINDLEEELGDGGNWLAFLNHGYDVEFVDGEGNLPAVGHPETRAQRVAARGLFRFRGQAWPGSRLLGALLYPRDCARLSGR